MRDSKELEEPQQVNMKVKTIAQLMSNKIYFKLMKKEFEDLD